jgi:hypothetical protein
MKKLPWYWVLLLVLHVHHHGSRVYNASAAANLVAHAAASAHTLSMMALYCSDRTRNKSRTGQSVRRNMVRLEEQNQDLMAGINTGKGFKLPGDERLLLQA